MKKMAMSTIWARKQSYTTTNCVGFTSYEECTQN